MIDRVAGGRVLIRKTVCGGLEKLLSTLYFLEIHGVIRVFICYFDYLFPLSECTVL